MFYEDRGLSPSMTWGTILHGLLWSLVDPVIHLVEENPRGRVKKATSRGLESKAWGKGGTGNYHIERDEI